MDRSPSAWGPLGLDSINQYLSELLLQLTMGIENDTWSPGCEHFTRQLLCHVILPFCKKQGDLEGRERKREKIISLFAETAAPMLACSGCQLLDTIQFCSTVVYSRLVTEMRRQSLKFLFQPDNCLDDTATGHSLYPIGPDCMPHPQGLPSETGEIIPLQLFTKFLLQMRALL